MRVLDHSVEDYASGETRLGRLGLWLAVFCILNPLLVFIASALVTYVSVHRFYGLFVLELLLCVFLSVVAFIMTFRGANKRWPGMGVSLFAGLFNLLAFLSAAISD